MGLGLAIITYYDMQAGSGQINDGWSWRWQVQTLHWPSVYVETRGEYSSTKSFYLPLYKIYGNLLLIAMISLQISLILRKYILNITQKWLKIFIFPQSQP